MTSRCTLPSLSTAWLLLAAGCGTAAGHDQHSHHPRVPVTVPLPDLAASQSVTLPGLHNVVRYSDRALSGSVPEGREGLHTLAAMGVKTVISVDGAEPDAASAESLGLRYIHLPISYNGIAPERQQELAQAVANTDGPIYVHCHHGKHRSASALGSALVLCGALTPEAAVQRMKVSGTGENYQGLWRAVQQAAPLPASALRADVAKFPKVAKVKGLVAIMSEVDVVFENVTHLQKAAWATPADHPDLLPSKETSRLHNLFVQMHGDADSQQHGAAYQALLAKAIDQAQALDAAVKANDRNAADAQFGALQKNCKECHKAHRDNA
ncbi:MAG: cytochrome c [Planctomycetes bacterium]|nr:cytochrome c [Planctomycetota bacterium]